MSSPRETTEPARPAAAGGIERVGAEGERKHVTVLFADVTASMDVLTRHDAEDAAAIFDRVLEYMREAVQRYEGTVNQKLGDGILALFGAPIAYEDHAVRACYAALRMQERISEYGDAIQRSHGLPILIRVGLHSGEVVIRSTGGDPNAALSVVGQTVHLASRMEQLAKPGTIVATAETIALAGPRVRAKALGAMRVKGLAEPVQVHEVAGASSSLSRLDAPLSPNISPFLGREDEIAALQACLQAVREGAGRLAAVTGEPGVGKSRLVLEFVREARAQGCTVIGAAAVPYARSVGQRAGLEIVRGYFGLDRHEDPAVVRHTVRSRMRALDPALEEHAPATLWQLGVLEEGSSFWSLDFASRRLRALEANVRVIGAEARHRPFVMVFENFQWADSDTEQSLKILSADLPSGTLAVVTYRPDYDDTWLRVPGVSHVRLDALPTPIAESLLDALLGPDPDLDPVKRLLVERTGGNPLFLEESVRDLVQSGKLAGERGSYRRDGPITAIDVPATVRSVIQARIDRLPAADKRVLQCAAVIGEQVPASLLERVVDLPANDVRAAEGRLRAAEFLEGRTLFPEPLHAFRHSLTHDVAYGSLLHDRRRQLHARVMTALEHLNGDAPAETAEALAHHAFHGEIWDKAVEYSRQAAMKSRSGLGGREAVGLLQQALVALGHLPDTPASRGLAVDIREELCGALVPLGEHRQILTYLREAESVAAGLNDDRRRARTLSLLCNAHWELGNSADAMEAGERAVALAEKTGAPELQIGANFSLGGAARAVGDYRRAEALLRHNLALIPPERAAEHFRLAGVASVLTRGHLAWTLAELGHFREAVQRAEEAIRVAQTANHAYTLAHAQLGLGGTLLRQGRIGEAGAVLERGLALVKDAPFLYAPMAADLAVVYALSGRPGAAVELAERAVARAERMGRLGRLSLIVTHLSEAYLLAGRVEEACAQAQHAFDLARERGERGNQVYALRLLGLTVEGDPTRAADVGAHYRAALGLAEELSMRPLVARCHLALGRLARRLGDHQTASGHLSRAGDLLQEMEMPYWLNLLALDRAAPMFI